MLTACIGSSIHAPDERRLYQSVCDILVRSELFQFAWFGYPDLNSQTVVEPIAHSANTDGFIDELKQALGRDDYEDPATISIRTGDTCWIKNISAHPGLEAIQAAVLRHGYTSVISVPVIADHKAHGVLSVFYDNPEAYGQGVVDLLKEQLLHLQAAFAERPPNPRPRSEELELELRNLIDVLPDHIALVDAGGMLLHLNRASIEYHGYSVEEMRGGAHVSINHPDDFEKLLLTLAAGFASGASFEYEQRLRRKDNQYRWFLGRSTPIRDQDGQIIRWCASATDIEERKQAEERVRQSEADLLEAQRISHTGSWKHNLKTDIVTITPEMARMFAVPEGERSIVAELFFSRLHPEDRRSQEISYREAIAAKTDFESNYRIVLPDGSIMHVHNIGHPKLDDAGDLVGFVGTVLDVTAAKEAEEKLRQSEKEARQLLDLAPIHITEFGPHGDRIYNNLAALDYYGLVLEQWRESDSRALVHPQDWELVADDIPDRFRRASPFEIEVRLRRGDGQFRWFHYRFSPMRDEHGRITRWYAAGTDIDDRKAAEQRLRDENVSLREEVDKASMFEEIVGTSEPLKKVVARIGQVAPTDSGVLITGETGTGKELVARAIHRRSRRSARPFVSVNCAAVPRDLIASELFGHEKGAFTGATQRRLGKFELASGGTILLDEIGELPPETQIALLRVLQEREIERVGGAGAMRIDVRVIAATNRNLEAAIAAGMFRSDLYFRLNVFPIEVPSLRERRADIPLLVEYFLDRYARKAGKSFRTIDKRSLDLLQSYSWPGNIRELQNVIERSVIVSETDGFSVDESWLSRHPAAPVANPGASLSKKVPSEEKAIIEAALNECGGRVYGPSGAAAMLGMPRSTLESKIRSLKIRKHLFRDPEGAKTS